MQIDKEQLLKLANLSLRVSSLIPKYDVDGADREAVAKAVRELIELALTIPDCVPDKVKKIKAEAELYASLPLTQFD